ncbi:Transcriptional regulator, TetR family [[Actinomadura] parvosata subsp. kistnae]|uniref:TetR/AcrR family transcriptional regulator n=1 Tax=[Actinomadura] parvosata TaxID=1955412 RepID=UPI000D279FE0|nr:Transcriptional regulator, TetR family [Actinomadura parvosata subsp. kistnae]
MRRGYATGAARRERILATALLEFAEHGYRGASLARIAERAGLSQAGLLHHFRNKELLLIAVLDYRDELDARTFDIEGPAVSTRCAPWPAWSSTTPGCRAWCSCSP